jgi:phosphoribosylformylglycinamidine synthase
LSTDLRRIYVEKRPGFDVEAQNLYHGLQENLNIKGLEGVRVVHRYDITGITAEEYAVARPLIFAEPPVDLSYDEELLVGADERALALEYLPGQYDQQADSAIQCLQLLTRKERPLVRCARVLLLRGRLSQEDFDRIKNYCLNPIEAREADLSKPQSLELETEPPPDVKLLKGFRKKSLSELQALFYALELAMNFELQHQNQAVFLRKFLLKIITVVRRDRMPRHMRRSSCCARQGDCWGAGVSWGRLSM